MPIKEISVVEKSEVCYTGDTSIDGLINTSADCNEADSNDLKSSSLEYLRQGFKAPLILSECTYLDPNDAEKSKSRGHLNVKDIAEILRSHDWKTSDSHGESNILLYHISARHGPAKHLLDTLIRELPREVVRVADVAIASFVHDGTPLQIKPNGCISLQDYANREDIFDSKLS